MEWSLPVREIDWYEAPSLISIFGLSNYISIVLNICANSQTVSVNLEWIEYQVISYVIFIETMLKLDHIS